MCDLDLIVKKGIEDAESYLDDDYQFHVDISEFNPSNISSVLVCSMR